MSSTSVPLFTYLCLIAEEFYNKLIFFYLKSLAFKAQLVISHILSSLNLQMAFMFRVALKLVFVCFWFGLVRFFYSNSLDYTKS